MSKSNLGNENNLSKMASNAPTDFHHPYQPYDVQLDFMRTVYDVLEKGDGQVGILESPTGTVLLSLPHQTPPTNTRESKSINKSQGKSLSLICATLTWLRNHKRARYEASFDATAAGMRDEPEWMVEAALRRKRVELAREWEERERALERVRVREKEMEANRERNGVERGAKRARVGDHGGLAGRREVDEEREFLIEDWEGADQEGASECLGGLTKETRALMEKVGLGGGKRREDGEGEGEVEDQVKVCCPARQNVSFTGFRIANSLISQLRRWSASVISTNII